MTNAASNLYDDYFPLSFSYHSSLTRLKEDGEHMTEAVDCSGKEETRSEEILTKWCLLVFHFCWLQRHNGSAFSTYILAPSWRCRLQGFEIIVSPSGSWDTLSQRLVSFW